MNKKINEDENEWKTPYIPVKHASSELALAPLCKERMNAHLIIDDKDDEEFSDISDKYHPCQR